MAQTKDPNVFGSLIDGLGKLEDELEVEKVLSDMKGFIESHLFISTKEPKIRQFILNNCQQHAMGVIQDMIDRKIPIRLIILKARQLGMSTLIEAIIFTLTITQPNIVSYIIAHIKEATQNLYGMTELYYDLLPEDQKPMKRYRSKNELYFANPKESLRGTDPGLRSQIKVQTAKNADAGRSDTVHFIHASEVAFWDDPGTLLTGMLQAMPDNVPLTMVALESTANGVGNYFHIEWELAEKGESIYTPLFYPWQGDPSYALEIAPQDLDDFMVNLSDKEKKIREKHGLTLEQLNWRKRKIRQLQAQALSEKNPEKVGLDGSQLFDQEYPCEPRDAFLATGRPFFNMEALQWHEERCVEPEKIGNLFDAKSGKIEFEERDDGFIKQWEPPKPGEGYIIGIDIAQGLSGGDYSCMQVISQKGFALVASWWGHIDPDLLIDEAEMLGWYYNRAFLVVEVNNFGLGVASALNNRRYPQLYQRKRKGLRHERETDEIGFQTNKKTKPEILANMGGDLREHTIKVYDADTIDECFKFVRLDNGQMEAQEGSFDDRVMALALAVEGHQKAPTMFRRNKELQSNRNGTNIRGEGRGMGNTDADDYTGYY